MLYLNHGSKFSENVFFFFPLEEVGVLSHFYENYMSGGHANTSSGVRLLGFNALLLNHC